MVSLSRHVLLCLIHLIESLLYDRRRFCIMGRNLNVERPLDSTDYIYLLICDSY